MKKKLVPTFCEILSWETGRSLTVKKTKFNMFKWPLFNTKHYEEAEDKLKELISQPD